MNQPEGLNCKRAGTEIRESGKKPYHRPEFRFERVFETQALACSKQGTQAQCFNNPPTKS